jgi:hypothetical protein
MALGGKRPGAGRKPGTKNAKTLEKERVLAEVRERIMRSAQLILDGQLSLARGQQFLYKIEKELVVGPKGGKKYVSSKPKLVTDQWEIEAWLEGEIQNGDMEDENDPDATYYFLTTKEPNNMAIDSMLDRAFGKSTQRTEVSSPDGQPIIFMPVELMDKYNLTNEANPRPKPNSKG